MTQTFNHPINHIAIAVPDVEAAARWYKDVLGMQELRQMTVHDRALTPGGSIFKIYPQSLNRVKVAYLSAGNGIGVELFEFMDPKIQTGCEAEFERDYQRGGLFHFAITTTNVEELLQKIAATGGKQFGETISPANGVKAAYVADPWGNVVELLDISFERLMSNR
jgi:catechol 2,3-dioxygenase-like lactoylglutathione lyase family enzyme